MYQTSHRLNNTQRTPTLYNFSRFISLLSGASALPNPIRSTFTQAKYIQKMIGKSDAVFHMAHNDLIPCHFFKDKSIIYLLFNSSNAQCTELYVGKSIDFSNRIKRHHIVKNRENVPWECVAFIIGDRSYAKEVEDGEAIIINTLALESLSTPNLLMLNKVKPKQMKTDTVKNIVLQMNAAQLINELSIDGVEIIL